MKESCTRRRSYNRIDKNRKLELLKMTLIEGKSIQEATTKLQINYATAKTIIAHYKVKGEIQKERKIVKKDQEEE